MKRFVIASSIVLMIALACSASSTTFQPTPTPPESAISSPIPAASSINLNATPSGDSLEGQLAGLVTFPQSNFTLWRTLSPEGYRSSEWEARSDGMSVDVVSIHPTSGTILITIEFEINESGVGIAKAGPQGNFDAAHFFVNIVAGQATCLKRWNDPQGTLFDLFCFRVSTVSPGTFEVAFQE